MAAGADANGFAAATCTRVLRWTPQLGDTAADLIFYGRDAQGMTSDLLQFRITVTTSQVLYLSGTVNTFASTHPDFNRQIVSGDTSISLVRTAIGSNGRPVFQPSGKNCV